MSDTAETQAHIDMLRTELTLQRDLVATYYDQSLRAEARASAAEAGMERLSRELAHGRRVFEAMIAAFEGRPVPDDLRDQGLVQQAIRVRTQIVETMPSC